MHCAAELLLFPAALLYWTVSCWYLSPDVICWLISLAAIDCAVCLLVAASCLCLVFCAAVSGYAPLYNLSAVFWLLPYFVLLHPCISSDQFCD